MSACACLWNYSVACKWEGACFGERVCESALTPSSTCFLSAPGLENVRLNLRPLTCAACSPHRQISVINEEKRETITGYSHVSPRGAKMKGESATKDATLAKCPLFELNDFIILTYPAECLRIFHSGTRNFTLHAPVSAIASQSGHCLTSEGRARPAKSMSSISRLIQSACSMAYLRV